MVVAGELEGLGRLSARALKTISTTKTQRHKEKAERQIVRRPLFVFVSLCLCGFTLLKNQLHLAEQRKQRLARINDRVIAGAKLSQVSRAIAGGVGVDIAKAAARFERGRPKRQRHVID